MTQWTVAVDATFLPGSIVDSSGGMPGGVVISNANKTLRWGTDLGDGQSGLDIGNSPVSTAVTTGVGVVLPATLKTGSLLATGAALVSAIPWGLVTATGLAVWRFALRRKP